MSAPEILKELTGAWTGTSSLWLSPEDEPDQCVSTAWLALAAKGQFFSLQYHWSYNGVLQEGLLLIGYEKAADQVNGIWVDSWHMSDKFMVCEGDGDQTEKISILGAYSAPPGPDWGWRINVEPVDQNTFHLLMYNITPDGEEMLAVKGVYNRSQ